MRRDLHAVIMAGGRGTRFWPASTRSRPKQFMDLLGAGTLLQNTVARLEGLCPMERILVVTGRDFEREVMSQLPGLPVENLLLEPMPMNTSACIGWAASVLADRGLSGDLMAVLPSDHAVSPPEGFRETLLDACRAADAGWLCTVGVKPDRPATGYGYLEAGGTGDGFMVVSSFREKPDSETAEAFLAGGRHYWNAGIFVWRVETILDEIRRHLPELSDGLKNLGRTTKASTGLYARLPSISIDYGVMEKASRVAMVPARFSWDDVGDWPALRRSGACRGEALLIGSSDCTVWNPGGLTVLMGLERVSVVNSNGVVLVMSDDYAQKLRDVVTGLERDRPELV
ncbi:mannose-1-phosphate guanylyltransferase [Candidatus Fermentibacteria bacterium]|nr:mannose-1-phosphate guanylyltransferase [Candidatus Fermentibacteria bacterium]